MECYNPIRIPNVQFLQSSTQLIRTYANGGLFLGKNQLIADKIYNNTSSYIYVPCRKCPPCIRRRASEWSGRLAREISHNLSNGLQTAFVTLTYSPKFIKGARNRYKKDVATFFDRLRSKFRKNIRHFVISELGEKKGRFHIHALLFGIDSDVFGPKTHLWRDSHGYLHGSNPMLVERWQFGIVDTTIVKTVGAGVYIAGYLTKNRPQKNGKYFVSPIIASNGIGYKDVTQREISNISSSLACNILPYYEVGGKRYQYPLSMINKHLSLEDRLKLSALSAGKQDTLGGSFVVGTNRLRDYSEFQNQIKGYTSPLLMFNTSQKYLWSSGKNIKENLNFLNERSEYATFQASFDAFYPQMVAESIMYKYRNLMSNYCPF